MSQLSLFADADGVDPAPVGAALCGLAAALPARIRLGTSSWSFPGWTGLGAKAGPLVVRWNLHAGRSYDNAKADYSPFNRIVEEDLPSRTALARLARTAAAAGRDVYVTINNKAEGSAPLSVEHLAQAIAAGE